jgi:hypothetical protein
MSLIGNLDRHRMLEAVLDGRASQLIDLAKANLTR